MSNIIPYNRKLPMIRDLKNSVPLEQTLPIVFAKMGLKPDNWPSKDPKFNEWQLLLDHIKTNYRTIRVEEIKIAFEYALKGKIEVDTQHYQNFSCEYFSRIMNAYLKYKVPFSRQTERLPKPKPEEESKKVLKHFLTSYQRMLDGGDYQFNRMEWLYFQELEKAGIEIISNEDKKKLYQEVKEELKPDFREAPENYEYRVKKECRKRSFKDWVLNNVINETKIEL